MQDLKGFQSPSKGIDKLAVSMEIERIYKACPETSYIQACLEFCEKYDYDPSDVPKLISKTLRDKIEVEAINANLIRNKSKGGRGLEQWF